MKGEQLNVFPYYDFILSGAISKLNSLHGNIPYRCQLQV